MKKEEFTKTRVNQSDYYWCERCKISSDHGSRRIPCPRGGCEAKIRGEYTTTTTKDFKPVALPPPLDWSACNGCANRVTGFGMFPFMDCNKCIKSPTVDGTEDYHKDYYKAK